jgi:hypothetical protein
VGLWALIAGLPALLRIALVAVMAGALVLLFAVPLARRVFALQPPPRRGRHVGGLHRRGGHRGSHPVDALARSARHP